MKWTELAPWLTAPGIGALAYVFLKLHYSAVNAYKEMANSWRELYREKDRQLNDVVGAVREAKDRVP